MNRIKLLPGAVLLLLLSACTDKNPIVDLVPNEPGTAPNYWCTWYWQNYLILAGQEVENPDPRAVYSNPAARETLTEETVFGETGMARVILPKTRSDYYFVIDHGWQDKTIKERTFFTLIMDTLDFPRYAHLAPQDRFKQMNEDIKELGWRGLGLWVRGSPSADEMKQYVAWCKEAGIEYWKIDGGDTKEYLATQYKNELHPKLVLEHIAGAGPLTPNWNTPGLSEYWSVYHPEQNPAKSQKSLEILQNTDVFRTYDAAPLLVSTTTLQRVHDLLKLTSGQSEYRAILNIQDDCNIAAALGLVVAVKRHPMETPRMYKGKDFHLQIAGDRHVNKRLNEMDRLAMWQRIAPPMPAGYGTYRASSEFLLDSILFEEQHTWLKATHGKMVRQSAPAIMTRNLPLPKVTTEGLKPYVMASAFPNGAIAVATEGRVTPDNSWQHPKAQVELNVKSWEVPIGVFGHYDELVLSFEEQLPSSLSIYAQDLLAPEAQAITNLVQIIDNKLILPGALIDEIGTSMKDEGDISVPGLLIQIKKSN